MASVKEVSDFDSLRPLLCSFLSTNDVSGHTEYEVRLAVPHLPSLSWTIKKRYNDFVALHDTLSVFGLPIELPPKKAFGNKDREFVAERLHALQNYCRSLVENIFALSSKPMKQFLHPGSRISDVAGSAMQLMAMVFRTDNRFDISEGLPEIGWTLNKEFALVKSLKEPKLKFIGYWMFYGPDRKMVASDISALFLSLCQTQYPLFFPVLFADARETGCVVIHAENSAGSLMDCIKNAKYRQSFLMKYGKTKRGKGLGMEEIQRYGRQILETLKFFHDNAIPYGNLSSRNVIICQGKACITEIGNGVCGLRSFYWPYILQFRKINTFEAIDIYCFGHLLYEMVFGQSLESATCTNMSPVCPPLIRAVLESILTPEACKVGMPSVSQLLTQPLFTNIVLNQEQVSMKMSRKLKEALVDAKQKMELRFVEEQKLYHLHNKELKVMSFQSSEDEKKKRRLQTLKSQISTVLEDGSVNGRPLTPTNTDRFADASTALDETRNMPPKVPPQSRPIPPPPPPTMPATPINSKPDGSLSVAPERNALLTSIRTFKKDELATVETIDKSAPIIS